MILSGSGLLTTTSLLLSGGVGAAKEARLVFLALVFLAVGIYGIIVTHKGKDRKDGYLVKESVI